MKAMDLVHRTYEWNAKSWVLKKLQMYEPKETYHIGRPHKDGYWSPKQVTSTWRTKQ